MPKLTADLGELEHRNITQMLKMAFKASKVAQTSLLQTIQKTFAPFTR